LSFDAATQVVVAAAAVIAPGLITNTNTNADAQIPYQRSAIHRKSRCYVEDFGLIYRGVKGKDADRKHKKQACIDKKGTLGILFLVIQMKFTNKNNFIDKLKT